MAARVRPPERVARQLRLRRDMDRQRPRAALVAGALLSAALCACNFGSRGGAERASQPLAELIVEVETARLRRGDIAQVISAPGSLVASRESQIGAEVSGRIVRVHVSQGDRV